MNIDNHTAIFNAYLSRLSVNDIDQLHKMINEVWRATVNSGTRTQLKVQQEQKELVKHIIGNFLLHDLSLIEEIVDNENH